MTVDPVQTALQQELGPPPAWNSIDVHHHIVPAFYREALQANGLLNPVPGVQFPEWHVEASLEMMDQQSIATAIVSITVPGADLPDPLAGAALARRLNEYMANLGQVHPGRFGGFAVIPMHSPDAALAEMRYALDTLKLDGIGLFTNYRGVYLGDPTFEPILDEAHQREAVIHVHPAAPPGTDQPSFGLPASLYEFTFDTTRLAAQLLYTRTLERYPGMRMILSHGGGALPYLAQRLTFAPVIKPSLAESQPEDPIRVLRTLYFDLAMSGNPYTLPTLNAFVPKTKILYGTDFPFMPAWTADEGARNVLAFPGFSSDDLRRIARENAEDLFPRLNSVADHTRSSTPQRIHHVPALQTTPEQR